MNSIKEKFDEFISQYPIFEYRVLDTGDIKVHIGLSSGSGRAVRMRKEDPELSESSFLFQRCGGIGYHEHEGDAFHKNGTRSAYREGT